MGLSQYPLQGPHFDLEAIHNHDQENKQDMCNVESNGSLWEKVMETGAKKQRTSREKMMMMMRSRRRIRNNRRVLMKRISRGARVGRNSRRPAKEFERKVKTLKRLVPNTHSSPGLEGLFRNTADYILSLQMRVRVMQIMVQVLTVSDQATD